MRNTMGIAILLAWVAGTAPAQTYHAAEYISGGAWLSAIGAPYSNYLKGLVLMRGDGRVATLAQPSYTATAFAMDVDNRHVVALVTDPGNTSNKSGMAGLYRFDPATTTYTTIYGPDTTLCQRTGHLWIDQDGDYVFNTSWVTSAGWTSGVMKVTAGGRLTTLLTSANLGYNAFPCGYIGCNHHNGKLMVVAGMQIQSSMLAPVLEFDANGVVTTFNDSLIGWSGCAQYHLEQNVLNGHIEGPCDAWLLRLTRGSSPRTAIGPLKVSSGVARRVYTARFDLQTAPIQRMVSLPSNPGQPGMQQWLLYIAPDGAVTSMLYTRLSRAVPSNYDLAFYRGRHIQTVKTGTHRWSILLSCPRSPGKAYRLAAGFSGMRPGVMLPDGRRINLKVDPLTYATVNNLLPWIFNPGGPRLNANGEARGWIDLSLLRPPPGGFGIPLWIAMVVLDPQAPCGILYLPDTYAMRI
jgi:hypothetical protein